MAAVRPTAVVGLVALALAALVAPAAGSVTVGQVAPGAITSCSNNFEFLQVSTPDNSYAMPATGTLTSWTHRSQAGNGQTPTLKIYRKIGDPARYQVVGHDGPHPIPANTTMSFSASVPVKAGDVLGITGAGGAVNIGCQFTGPGEEAFRMSNLADGVSDDFTTGTGSRVNVSAVLNPANTFTVGKTTRHKKKGTATLSLSLPNPGELGVSAGGASASGVTTKSVQAGDVQVLIKAKGRKRRTLNKTGKVKLSVALAFTPTGGDLSSRLVSVKLKKQTK